MSYNTPPRHDLFDLQGEKQYATGVKWHIEQREYQKGALVFTPSPRLNEDEVSRLRWLKSIIADREIEVRSDGVVIVPINFGEKFGWILGKTASFYRMAKNKGMFVYE